VFQVVDSLPSKGEALISNPSAATKQKRSIVLNNLLKIIDAYLK
jgi:hypothetical protein